VRDLIRGSLVTMALALFCLPGVADAAKPGPKPKPKPHLVVKSLTFQSSPAESNSKAYPFVVIESDRTGQFGLLFTVKNIGKGRARKSDARVLFSGKQFKTEPIGALGPGRQTTIGENYKPHFKGPGLFDVTVCVGDDECAKPIGFAGVVRRWRVITWTTGPNSLTGIAPFFAAKAENLTFDFFGPVREGDDISYTWLANGGLSGETTGNDGFCSYTGDGETTNSPWDVIEPNVGYLTMTPQLDGYFAELNDKDYSFTTTQSCPGYPDNPTTGAISPLETLSLDGRVDQPMDQNATALGGGYTIPTDIGSGSTVGEWSFRADFP
jgi:hypothetical protein